MDKHIGAQYYTLRNFIKTVEEFHESCKKVADIGYKVVQMSGCPLKAEEIKPILDKYGLKVCGTHKGYDDFINNIEEVIAYNKTLGSDICGLGSMPWDIIESEEKIDKFISDMAKVCERIKQEGMYFAYHNHAFEFVKKNGKTVYDRLINETDPETFNFIVDTYWLQVGGKDPADVIRSLGKRAMIIHFKDYTINPDDIWKNEMAEVGKGNLDWDKIIEASSQARYAVVEQDTCRTDPFSCLETSYKYLTNKGFC